MFILHFIFNKNYHKVIHINHLIIMQHIIIQKTRESLVKIIFHNKGQLLFIVRSGDHRGQDSISQIINKRPCFSNLINVMPLLSPVFPISSLFLSNCTNQWSYKSRRAPLIYNSCLENTGISVTPLIPESFTFLVTCYLHSPY